MIKTWGIIGAMEVEVEDLRDRLENVMVSKIASMYFYDGTFEGKRVIVVRSGVGKVNAAMCTQILVDRYNVSAVINTGIAGSLKNEIDIGDIVVSTDAVQHDVDATVFGYKKGQIPQSEEYIFPANKELRELAVRVCRESIPGIKVFEGRILSGDQFVSDDAVKADLVREFGGYCTEMEGASIAQAAWLNKVPFVILRAISDKADGSAGMVYDEFEKMAAVNSVTLVTNMIREGR
ncbi:MAG: 5'-methylthioadenosine/adenosylhomocysteine nucleosidase [Lachnospiraceae bacterium]|nr:5'-methylthioadenosine/adenosylhomocysteine nucleosidase [Lachnospiraceae bacterium]